MNTQYKLIVFDWEGTLSDPYGAILQAIEESAHILGYPAFDKTLAYKKMGLGLPIVLKHLFPSLNTYEQEVLLQLVQPKIIQHSHELYINIGAKETVKCLYDKGIATAIATNRGQTSLQRALSASGLEAYISTTRCAGQCPLKPAPDMLQEIMFTCDALPTQTLMIGDSSSDIAMALACNVTAIGLDVTYQLKSELETAGATTVLHSYNELNAYLNLGIL